MRITSVRLRLALWNVGVLALVLVAFGAAIRYTDQLNQIRYLDRQLDFHADVLLGVPFGADGHGPPPPDFGPLDAIGPGPAPGGFGPPGMGVGLGMGGRLGRRGALRRGGVAGSGFEMGRRPGPPPSSPPGAGGWGRVWRPPDGSISILQGPPPGDHPPLPFEARLLDPGGRVLWNSVGARWGRIAFAKALQGQRVYLTTTVDGEPMRLLSLAVRQDERELGVLELATPLSGVYTELTQLSGTILALFPLALLVAALGGLWLTERALRPVRQITHAAAQIGASDLSDRLPVQGKDEFSELAATFNGMLGRLEHAFSQLGRALEQQRRFTADASHELRTPLTIIKANTSLALEEERSNAEYKRALEAADRATDTTTRIVQDLLLLARSDAGQLRLDLRPTCLSEVLESAAEAFAPVAPIAVQLSQPTLFVPGDPHHLVRLFTNLLQNAVHHTPATGSITVTASAEGDCVVVRVRDTGEGISPEHLPHVCERFYRVDAARTRRQGGTGLGLSICQSIVEAHHGSLQIESVLGKGTTVTVRLPAVS